MISLKADVLRQAFEINVSDLKAFDDDTPPNVVPVTDLQYEVTSGDVDNFPAKLDPSPGHPLRITSDVGGSNPDGTNRLVLLDVAVKNAAGDVLGHIGDTVSIESGDAKTLTGGSIKSLGNASDTDAPAPS